MSEITFSSGNFMFNKNIIEFFCIDLNIKLLQMSSINQRAKHMIILKNDKITFRKANINLPLFYSKHTGLAKNYS
jgi:hypothetical protein